VRVDGKRVKAAHRLSAGEVIRIPPIDTEPRPATARPPKREVGAAREDRQFLESITLYRDDAVLVLNKPAGLPVQGGTGQKRNLDAMLRNLTRSGEPPRLVHRLDKDTSGVIAVGLTRQATAALAAAFRGRDVRKLYWAVVVGTPARRRGFIDLSLAKRGGPGGERVVIAEDMETGEKMADAQSARSRFAVIDHAANQVTWL
ncbi:MAG: RluA family pseudouridine synthase, partial [Ottowia sp.]|nr:RluA family pseudouridine synthase [Ottowia sp.]